MPSTSATHDIEDIRPSGGGGAFGRGNDGYDGGGGEGSEPSGRRELVPQRTYITGMTVGLGGILMFFMALVSAYIVRKGMPNSGWIPLPVFPRILWFNTAILVASSFTLAHSRRLFRSGDDS